MNTTSTPNRSSSRKPIYRTVLSLAVAALIAASIPFSAMYSKAVQSSPPVISAQTTTKAGGQKVKLVTTASGRQIAVPVSGSSSGTAQTQVPITTRTSNSD